MKDIVLALTAALALCMGRTAADRPNIIVLMADDLGAEAIGCYGSTSYITPHLDQMAKDGIRFNNAYATPLCTPTRAMIMTGLYPHITGHRTLISKANNERMSPEHKTFGHYFSDAGYATAIAGKWQLAQFQTYPDHPKEMGFDQHCLWKWMWNGKKTTRYWQPAIWENGKEMDGDEHVYGPDRYSNFLFDFIRENKDQPFFIYYPMALTHNPFPDPPPMPLDEKQHPKSHQGFARMVSYADHIVGQFNALLTELDLDKNTLILFTGDNGTNTSLTSHLGDLVIKGGKGKMTEAGTRVPLIAKWPAKVKAGTDSEKLISLVDLLPTFNAIADIPTADNVSGMDLSHYFTGKKGTDRDHIFVCYGNGYFVRTPEWRLHNTGKLFHIPVTSNERRYSEKSMEAPERQQELQKLLDRYKTAATGGSNGEQRKKKQGDKSKKKAK